MNQPCEQLPWHNDAQVRHLIRIYDNAHAVLLKGQQRIGKGHLAGRMAHHFLVRSDASGEALFCAGAHPDLHVLTSAESYQHLCPLLQGYAMRYLDAQSLQNKRLSRQIPIDCIRDLVHALSQSATRSGNKFAIIYPAEQLNINAANALLKFLEEPVGDTLLMLVSHDISKIPATVKSRCVYFNHELPEPSLSLHWLSARFKDRPAQQLEKALRLAAHRPLAAEALIDQNCDGIAAQLMIDLQKLISDNHSPVALAASWINFKQTDFILAWLCRLFAEVIRVQLARRVSAYSIFRTDELAFLGHALTVEKSFAIYDYLLRITRQYDGVIDQALLFESVLIKIITNLPNPSCTS